MPGSENIKATIQIEGDVLDVEDDVEDGEEEDQDMTWSEWAQIIFYSLAPIVTICVASSLLFIFVDESKQTILASQNTAGHLTLGGGGSNLAATTVWRWMALFKGSVKQNEYSVDLNYQSIGNKKGLMNLFSEQTLFALSEGIPLISTFANNNTSNNTLHHGTIILPVIAGALSIVYNIPGITAKDPPLVFDGVTLGAIFSGEIIWWNDTRIQSINPALELPHELISPIVTNDPTDIFPTYLSPYNAKINASNGFTWPNNFIRGNTAFELMYISGIVFNSIAYTPIEAVLQSGNAGRSPTLAGIINKRGEVVFPAVETVNAAMRSSFNPDVSEYMSITDSNATGAYPLSFLSFALIRQSYYPNTHGDEMDCLRVKLLVEMLYFSLVNSTAIQSMIESGWNPTSNEMVRNTLSRLSTVTCNGQNIMNQLEHDFQKNLFYTHVDYEWETSVSFWANLGSISVTRLGTAAYLTFYSLLILSNAIPFAMNMRSLDSDDRKSHSDKNHLVKVKWTLQNWLGVVTQCFTCFQIVYLSLNRSNVIQENIYVEVVSYIGLIFDWFWYYIVVNVLVLVWIVCMYYTTFLYGFLEFYFPEKLNRLTKLHMFLADFMPNFALIFYNPSVELLAKVFDCRMSPHTFEYKNSYDIKCWQGVHWIMIVFSISLSCAFTNCVVRYCKILKMLRKDFSFKDKDWSIYLESISKTVIIILYFNTSNKYFLPCNVVMMACLCCCSLFGQPNYVLWFDRIRGFLYAYCGGVCFILFIFEFVVQEEEFARRSDISKILSPVILGTTLVACFAVYSYSMMQFKAGLSDSDRRKQDAELKKFFAAFGDEIESASNLDLADIPEEEPLKNGQGKKSPVIVSSQVVISRHRSVNIDHDTAGSRPISGNQMGSSLMVRNDSKRKSGHLLPEPYIPGSHNDLDQDFDALMALHEPINFGPPTLITEFSAAQWQKLDQFVSKAFELGLLDSHEMEAIKVAITHEDPIIPILFGRYNKNLQKLTEVLKAKVWQVLIAQNVHRQKSEKSSKALSTARVSVLSQRSAGGRDSETRRESQSIRTRRRSNQSTRSRPLTGTDFQGFNVNTFQDDLISMEIREENVPSVSPSRRGSKAIETKTPASKSRPISQLSHLKDSRPPSHLPETKNVDDSAHAGSIRTSINTRSRPMSTAFEKAVEVELESAPQSRAGSRPTSAIFPSHTIRIEPPTPRDSFALQAHQRPVLNSNLLNTSTSSSVGMIRIVEEDIKPQPMITFTPGTPRTPKISRISSQNVHKSESSVCTTTQAEPMNEKPGAGMLRASSLKEEDRNTPCLSNTATSEIVAPLVVSKTPPSSPLTQSVPPPPKQQAAHHLTIDVASTATTSNIRPPTSPVSPKPQFNRASKVSPNLDRKKSFQ
ncbi:hypothetical protein BDR26DRAFT_1006694 [Obelidium mucronatum]|nr:hypothetical protein BDR26DRAFT_1006694 [Obelidium mucronatum]